MLDVCPRALGIGVAGGYNETVIEKNTPVPVERTRRFTTSKDYQTEVQIQVCQGESRRFQDNEMLGVLTLEGLPARVRGESGIEVTFTIDADGILNVHALDCQTKQETQATMKVIGAPEKEDGPAPPAKKPAIPRMTFDEQQVREKIRRYVDQAYAVLDQVDYYQLLSVSSASSDEEIRASYYRIAARLHPDVHGQEIDQALSWALDGCLLLVRSRPTRCYPTS